MYLTLKQTSKITGYSVRSIKKFIGEGTLPIRKMQDRSKPRIWDKDIHSVMMFGNPYLTLRPNLRYIIDKVVNG